MRYSILALTLILSSCTSQEVSEEGLRPIRAVTAEKKITSRIFNFTGFAQASVRTNLSFRVGGRIVQLPVRMGDRLKVGELIAKLEAQDYELELNKALSDQEKAEAEARNAAAHYRRIRKLYESESVSRNELDQARAQAESSSAFVEKAKSAVELARKQLSYTEIRAETDVCVIASVEKEVGENAAMGETVVTIDCGNQIDVEAAVPEAIISKFEVGMDVQVFFRAISREPYHGVVKEVGAATQGGATFPVTVSIREQDRQLHPGMAAQISLESQESDQEIIIIPFTAVGEEKGNHYVYVYEKINGRVGSVAKRWVKIGPPREDGIVITEGLESGEVVVTAGIRYLEEGRKVILP